MALYTAKPPTPSRIECMKWPDQPMVALSSTNFGGNCNVLIEIGESKSLITRTELAAAAVLFPVEKRRGASL